jgi:hypothetical protein
MQCEYDFSKDRLPKGRSYPLKRSVLDAALKEVGVSDIHFVSYVRGILNRSGTRQTVMQAHFYGEGGGWFAPGRSSISVHSVPSEERLAIEGELLAQGLPRIICWLQELKESGNTRRGVDQHFLVYWDSGTLVIESS